MTVSVCFLVGTIKAKAARKEILPLGGGRRDKGREGVNSGQRVRTGAGAATPFRTGVEGARLIIYMHT